MRQRSLLLVAAVTLALFVVAACGDDDDENGEPDTTPDEIPTMVDAEPACMDGPGVLGDVGTGGVTAAGMQEGDDLVIGVLVPSTGALSAFGADYINAANLAAQCLNNAGGINGGRVIIKTGDTGTSPEQGVAEATRLVDEEGVVAIVGAASSAVTLAVAEAVAVPNQILQVSMASAAPAITDFEDDDYLFRTSLSDAAQGVVLAQVVSGDLGLASVCAMYVDNADGQGLMDVFSQAFEALDGTVTAQVPHADAEAATYSTELTECTSDDPEALVAISYPMGQAAVYLEEALDAALIDTFVFADRTRTNAIFDELGWDLFDGMLGTAPGALETEFAGVVDSAFVANFGSMYSSPFVREVFDAVIVVGLAAQAAGANIDSTAIRDNLRDVSNSPGTVYGPSEEDIIAAVGALAAGEQMDYQGASGLVDFDENGDVTFGAIEIWRVDAESEALVVERRVSVDLVTGDVEDIG